MTALTGRRDDFALDAPLVELGHFVSVTTRCAFCPNWSYESDPEFARRAFERHAESVGHRVRAETTKSAEER